MGLFNNIRCSIDKSTLSFLKVSQIYLDASMGNRIQVSVVKLVILDESQSFVPKSRNAKISASDMLKAFCKWQYEGYLKNKPEPYDAALLLTRSLLCIKIS